MERRRQAALQERRRKKVQQKRNEHKEETRASRAAQIEHFQRLLGEFSILYWENIQKDGEFRRVFYATCVRLGLDPVLCCAVHRKSKEMLGDGDQMGDVDECYYNALGMAVMDVCHAREEYNGGLMELDVVVDMVRQRGGERVMLDGNGAGTTRTDYVIQTNDVRKAVWNLSSLGSGICVVRFGGKEYVKSMSSELSRDGTTLLELFHSCQGRLTVRNAMDDLGWSEERVTDGIHALAQLGLVWLDEPPEAMPPLFWCPAVKYDVSLAL